MIDYPWIPSPNFGYPRGTHGQNRPAAICWHITASNPTNPPLAGLDSWFQNPLAGATHLGIQDGEAHQYVAFEDAPWGNGYMDRPDLSNPHIKKWWERQHNPNLKTLSIEVIAMPGPAEVARGVHNVSDATWDTMQRVAVDLTGRSPEIELVPDDHIFHGQIDGVSRKRDTVNVYWPADILLAIGEDDEMFACIIQLEGDTPPTNTYLWRPGNALLHMKSKAQREDTAALHGISADAVKVDKATLAAL